MNTHNRKSKWVPVLLAVAVVVVLAGSLGARLIGRQGTVDGPVASPAVVGLPADLVVEELEIPCWSCPSAKDWPVRFQANLDLLTPLGNGSANAATWFVDFTKDIGPRRNEVSAAMESRIEGPEWLGQIFPADDPLLIEAEPWCDQATMIFYPEFFELEGYETRITNLLFPLTLVRSWVARGMAEEDSVRAMVDFRRAIRLGRLLRQEDTVVISDLVGLACIHIGARGVYRRALADGDLELALLASVVLGEVAPQRLRTMEHLTTTDLSDSLLQGPDGSFELSLRPDMFEVIIASARGNSDRRFRLEAIIGLNIVASIGSPEQQEIGGAVLDELADSNDPIIAETARWSRDTAPTQEFLKDWAKPPMK